MQRFEFTAEGRKCEAVCGSGAISRLADVVEKHSGAIAFVDKGAAGSSALKGLEAGIPMSVVSGGEELKEMAKVERLCEEMAAAELDREGVVVAIGGGATLDAVGFAAAVFKRGVTFVAVPTTLLAMVDASIGGKTACNLAAGKNLVGAFHLPKAVLMDTRFLESNTETMLLDGKVEAMKTGVVANEELFGLVLEDEALEEIVFASAREKARIIEADFREKGKRAVLNFGHTVGHAIEAAGSFRRFSHGEAVSLGMVAEAAIARERGILAAAEAERIVEGLKRIGAPIARGRLSVEEVVTAVHNDKKNRGGKIRVALPKKVGEMFVENRSFTCGVTEQDIARGLEAVLA